MSGFLGRVTRYVATGSKEPREDRLTQITAAVLERVPGLARDLALGWLDPETGSSAARELAVEDTRALHARIRSLVPDVTANADTQVILGERRLDLRVRFEDTDDDVGPEIWIEVKHGTDPHTGQVPAYVEACPPNGHVVLLSTRDRLPISDVTECPLDVPQRTWQATADRARRFARDRPPEEPVARWLLEEWLAYLREEGLMDPELLGPEHMTALQYTVEAEGAMGQLFHAAVSEFPAEPDEDGGRERPLSRLDRWALWHLDDSDDEHRRWNGAWFDWKLVVSTGRAHNIPRGHVFAMAGLSWTKGTVISGHPAWEDGLRSGVDRGGRRVTFTSWTGDCERLQRVGYLHQILRGDTLAEQGRELGRWITETYDVVIEHGPPPRL